MMIARFQIEARFGYKPGVIDATRKWCREVGAQIGWTEDKLRVLVGAIGAPESAVVLEVTVADLTELDAAWSKLATIEAHKQWGRELEPLVVSGSNRWEVFRIV